MNHPLLFVVGITIAAYLLPELLVAAFKVNIPWLFNIMSAVSVALISSAFLM
jgi:hypothetical protein